MISSEDRILIERKLFKRRRIDLITGCWLWTGSFNAKGYGQMKFGDKQPYVHRLSYEMYIGPITELVLHKLNCPNKNCFNPDHLYQGNDNDNSIDKITLNKYPHPNSTKTECKRGHEYTLENTYTYRNRRQCNKCRFLRRHGLLDK